MRGTKDRDVVKDFAADRADQSLGVRVLPWRSGRGRMIAYAHRAEALEEYPAVDSIAITNEMSRCLPPGEGLSQLSGDPLGGLAVTLTQTSRRRATPTMTNPYKRLKLIVGTTNRSIAAMSGA